MAKACYIQYVSSNKFIVDEKNSTTFQKLLQFIQRIGINAEKIDDLRFSVQIYCSKKKKELVDYRKREMTDVRLMFISVAESYSS